MDSVCAPTFPVGNFINPIIFDPNTITKYITNLPIPKKLKPCRVEQIACDNKLETEFNSTKASNRYETKINSMKKCKSFYDIRMVEIIHKLHPDIPPTKFWIYKGSELHNEEHNDEKNEEIPTNPLIEAERYNPVAVKWINDLPVKHLLEVYIDHTLHGADFPARM